MEEFGAVGGGEDQESSADEVCRVFEGRVAVGEAVGDLAVSFAGGDASELMAEFDAAGYGGDGEHSAGAIVDGRGDGGGGPEYVDDDHQATAEVVEVEQCRGEAGVEVGFG